MGMKMFCVLPLTLSLVSCVVFAQNAPESKDDRSEAVPINSSNPKNLVPLDTVVNAVEGVLTQVKGQIGSNDPQLTTAEFDFQTLTTNDTKFGLNIFIVTLEGEHEKDVTQETDFTYSIPAPPVAPHNAAAINIFGWVKKLWNSMHSPARPEDVGQDLPKAIIAAADSARLTKQIKNPWGTDLSHRKFVVTLTFQVKNTEDGTFDTSKLIQIGPEGKYSHVGSSTQTLKLTFEDPTKPPS